MKHRFYVDPIEPRVELTPDEAHHARVVRVRAGEEVEVFDGRGNAARGVVELIEHDRAVIAVGEPIDGRESPIAITLAMSIIQLEKFELVLQKATELGARTIVPLITDRIEVRPERWRGKEERWRRVVFEAVKQCGRAAIPAIEAAATFDEVIARAGTKIVFDAEAQTGKPAPHEGSVTLFIGPEGGFSERELALARNAGASFQQLGPRRLRAETAAIVATALFVRTDAGDRFTGHQTGGEVA